MRRERGREETYYEDYLRVGPDGVNPFYQHGVLGYVSVGSNIVRGVVVISSEIDDYDVRCRTLRKVPNLWLVAPNFNGSAAGV
jgi:hypothetical protein